MLMLTGKLQAMNIVFAACGIVGPIYGIGQRFAELDPKYLQTAMFVCDTIIRAKLDQF